MPGESAISKPRSLPMSLNTFLFEVGQCRQVLKEEESTLSEAYTLFASEKSIWPDQCKRVLTVLQRIEKPVQELYASLREPTYLPAHISQHRRLLLISLQHTDEQVQALTRSITDFRTMCQVSSKRVTKQRQEVERRLKILIKAYEEVLHNFQLFADLTRFRERKAVPSSQQSTELWREFHFYEKQGKVYNELGMKEEALKYLKEALRLVQKIGDRRKEAIVLNDLGRTFSVLGEKREALDYLQKALELVKEVEDRQPEGEVLNNLSLVYIDLGRQEEAKEYLEKALVLVQEIADHRQEGRIQNTFGLMFSDMGQRELAKTSFERALQLRREQRDRKGEGVTLNNLGWVYGNLGQKDQAWQCYRDALIIFREEGDLWGEGKTLSNLGLAYIECGEYEKSLLYCQQALVLLRRVGDHLEEWRTLNNLVHIYNNLGRRGFADEYYEEAQQILEEELGRTTSLKSARLRFDAMKESS